MSDIISNIVIFESKIIANMKVSDAGPFYSLRADVSRSSNGEKFVVFPNESDMEAFLEALGFDPEDRHCFGGDDWDDNAFSLYDLRVWAKDKMKVDVMYTPGWNN